MANPIDNLKPFKPGQSGNPKGRPPKERCIPDILLKIGKEQANSEMDKLEAVLRSVYKYALQGKSWAVEFIATRTEGKPKDTLELSGNVGGRNPWDDLSSDELREYIQSAISSADGPSA